MPFFADNDFTLFDNSDTSKRAEFELSGISTGTTRDITLVDASGTMVLHDASQTLTNKTLTTTGNTITLLDENFTLEDNGTSDQLDFELSSIVGSSRTLTFPPMDTATVNAPIVDGDLTYNGRTTDLSSTNFVFGTNRWMVMIYAEVTSAGSGTLTMTVNWTDSVGATSDSSTTLSLGSTGRTSALIPIKNTSGWATVSASMGGGSGTYNVLFRGLKMI